MKNVEKQNKLSGTGESTGKGLYTRPTISAPFIAEPKLRADPGHQQYEHKKPENYGRLVRSLIGKDHRNLIYCDVLLLHKFDMVESNDPVFADLSFYSMRSLVPNQGFVAKRYLVK